jgi:hypothetical protein
MTSSHGLSGAGRWHRHGPGLLQMKFFYFGMIVPLKNHTLKCRARCHSQCTNFMHQFLVYKIWLLCIHVYAVYYYVHILEWLTAHDHTPTWWDNGHFFQGSYFPVCSHDRAITVCQRIDELWVLTTVHYKTETKQLDKLQLGVWRPSTTARPIVTFFKARLLQYHLKTVEVQDVKSGQHQGTNFLNPRIAVTVCHSSRWSLVHPVVLPRTSAGALDLMARNSMT